MMKRPFYALAGAALISLVLSGPALAAGSSDSSTTNTASSDAYSQGMAAVTAENWALAISNFQTAATEDPSSADAFNMLAYSYRKSGDLDQAFANYDKALTLDPDHEEAHEYLGEAYLVSGDLAKAEEQLAKLDDICWLGCEAYDELEEAISTYKASN